MSKSSHCTSTPSAWNSHSEPNGKSRGMEDISLVTRAKLARELFLAPNQRRGAPCLRKLVLWSNLLGTQHTNEDLVNNYQVQDHHPRLHPNHPNQRNAPIETSPEDSHHHQEQNEAEFDWFEHLMEEIDDSDSESDSSDHAPDRHPQLQHSPPPADIVFESTENSSSTPLILIKELGCRSKRTGPSDTDHIKDSCRQLNELGRRTRRRLLSISSSSLQALPRKQLGRRHSKKRSSTLHPSPSTHLPYWGFIVPPHLPTTTLNQEANPSNSSIREDEEEDNYQYNSLPSLLSTKSSYLFESIDPIDNTCQYVGNHDDFGVQHPFVSSKTCGSLGQPELNSIDFSPYDFLISTTTNCSSHDQGNSILQVKYLIGNLGKFRAKSCHHSTTNRDEGENIRIRIGKQPRIHHSYSSSSRGLIVKKIHVVFNLLVDFNHYSHPDLYQNYCYPKCLIHHFDYHLLSLLRSKSSPFAWKVYGLHHS